MTVARSELTSVPRASFADARRRGVVDAYTGDVLAVEKASNAFPIGERHGTHSVMSVHGV